MKYNLFLSILWGIFLNPVWYNISIKLIIRNFLKRCMILKESKRQISEFGNFRNGRGKSKMSWFYGENCQNAVLWFHWLYFMSFCFTFTVFIIETNCCKNQYFCECPSKAWLIFWYIHSGQIPVMKNKCDKKIYPQPSNSKLLILLFLYIFNHYSFIIHVLFFFISAYFLL